MTEIVSSALADKGFVRWSVACLLLIALSWWIQDQLNFISLAGGWPPLTALQVLSAMVLDTAHIIGGVGVGIWGWVAGATVFRSPSRIMSPRAYVRNGLSAFSFIIGLVVILGVMGLLMAAVGSSGPFSYVVVLLGLEATLFAGTTRWRRQRNRANGCSFCDGTHLEERKDN